MSTEKHIKRIIIQIVLVYCYVRRVVGHQQTSVMIQNRDFRYELLKKNKKTD